MEKTWKSHDAGILGIIAGMIITAIGILSPFAIWDLSIPATLGTRGALFIAIPAGVALLSLGLFTIYGAEMAIKRHRWGLAFTASICASLVFLGIPFLILTILSRKEFTGKSSQGKGEQKEEK